AGTGRPPPHPPPEATRPGRSATPVQTGGRPWPWLLARPRLPEPWPAPARAAPAEPAGALVLAPAALSRSLSGVPVVVPLRLAADLPGSTGPGEPDSPPRDGSVPRARCSGPPPRSAPRLRRLPPLLREVHVCGASRTPPEHGGLFARRRRATNCSP